MTSRAFDIMRELPAILSAVDGITAESFDLFYRDPDSIDESLLPRVLIYNPSTAEPELPEFGLRAIEFGFVVLVVGQVDSDENTLRIAEDMAAIVERAALVNADRASMNPGSIVTDRERGRARVLASIIAQWEGV